LPPTPESFRIAKSTALGLDSPNRLRAFESEILTAPDSAAPLAVASRRLDDPPENRA
jgi:hypothetical protein